MGITINHFTHAFQRAAEPTPQAAQAMYSAMEPYDVWGVFPVTCGAIDWMGWHPEIMYGEPVALLSSGATGYLIAHVSQERGFAFWGEEGWKEFERDRRVAAQRSLRDLHQLTERLAQADAIRMRCCRCR